MPKNKPSKLRPALLWRSPWLLGFVLAALLIAIPASAARNTNARWCFPRPPGLAPSPP